MGQKVARRRRARVPAIWDDFSDGRYHKRTGKDPWGRALPEWPVEGATVTVINEQDDKKHSAVNLLAGRKYLRARSQVSAKGERYFTGQTANWFKGWARVNVMRKTATGPDGHTPLPRERARTLIITSRVETATSKPLTRTPDKVTRYTYTVRAHVPDGRTGEVRGLSPDANWYRANANEYQHTVKVVVK